MFKPGGWFAPSAGKTPGQAALEQMGGQGGGGDSKGNDKSKKDEDKNYSGSGFDPRGLERAAKAAKVCSFLSASLLSSALSISTCLCVDIMWQKREDSDK